jgi:hypothetical protein
LQQLQILAADADVDALVLAGCGARGLKIPCHEIGISHRAPLALFPGREQFLFLSWSVHLSSDRSLGLMKLTNLRLTARSQGRRAVNKSN